MKRAGGKERKKLQGIERIKSRYGMLFVLPWVIGLALFFFLPLAQSIWFSFADIKLSSGMQGEFVGLKNYHQVLMVDPNYTNNLRGALTQILYSVPVIVILSLILALILNQKFVGRLFFRGLYFLPVIIATGVVIELVFACLSGNPQTDTSLGSGSMISAKGGADTFAASVIDFDYLLTQLNLPDSVVTFLSTAIGNIFDLLWNCGIQIILFVAGLQSIPSQLYEVSKVEGSTKWEEFWFITLPMMIRIILLVMVFTLIQVFIDKSNPVIAQAYDLMRKGYYNEPSAMIWVYFAVIGVVLAAVIYLYHRLTRRWE